MAKKEEKVEVVVKEPKEEPKVAPESVVEGYINIDDPAHANKTYAELQKLAQK